MLLNECSDDVDILQLLRWCNDDGAASSKSNPVVKHMHICKKTSMTQWSQLCCASTCAKQICTAGVADASMQKLVYERTDLTEIERHPVQHLVAGSNASTL